MIIVYALCMLSVIFMSFLCAIQYYTHPQKTVANSVLLALIVFVIAFAFRFFGTPDIYRYYQTVEEYSQISLSEVFFYDKMGMYAFDILAWFIGKTGLYQLLPAITASSVYGIASYITSDYACLVGQQDKTYIIILLQLLSLPLFSLFSNIRNVFAFSLILLAAYEDLVKKRRGVYIIILYIVPCFIHNSAFVLLLFRLIAFISQKAMIIIAIIASFVSNIISFLYLSFWGKLSIGGSIGMILDTALFKAYHYINGVDNTDYSLAVQTSLYHNIVRWTTFFSAAILIYFSYRYIKNGKNQNKVFVAYLFLICISTVASNIFAAPNFWRFYAACNVGMGILLLPYVKERKLSIDKIIYYLFCACSVILTFLHAYGNRSFVDYRQTAENLVFTNVYTIIFQLLKACFSY